jgi:beta-lactamase regulating signal transducer with metallopeptidase domain
MTTGTLALDVVVAVTAVLAVGVVAVLVRRSPAERQRHVEAAVMGALLVGLLVVVPLPRWSASGASTEASGRLAPPGSSEPSADAETIAVPRVIPRASLPGPIDVVAATAETEEGAGPIAPPAVATDAVAADAIATDAIAADAMATDAATATAPDSTRTVNVATALVVAHLGGAVVAFVWLLVGYVRLRRRIAGATPMPVAVLRNLPPPPSGARLVVVATPLRPFCVGWRRPTIVVPQSLVDGPRDVLCAILRHEYAHAARGDGFGRLLHAIALPVLWSHPLFWWLQRHWRFAAERMADELAATTGRVAYARALLDYAERHAAVPAPLAPMSILWSTSDFYRRMTMLLQRENVRLDEVGRRARVMRAFPHVVIVALCAGFFGNPLAAQDEAAVREQLLTLQRQNSLLRAQLDSMRAEVQALMAARRDPRTQDNPVGARFRELDQREITEMVAAVEAQTLRREWLARNAESFESKDRSGLLSRLVEERDELLAKRESVDESNRKTLEAKLKETVDWIARLETERVADLDESRKDRLAERMAAQRAEAEQRRVEAEHRRQAELAKRVATTEAELADVEVHRALDRDLGGRAAFDPQSNSVRSLHDSLERLIEHTSALKLAREQFQRSQKLAEVGHVSADEHAALRHKIAVHEQKLELARAILESERDAAEAEIEVLSAQLKGPDVDAVTRARITAQIARAKTRVDLMQRFRR